jgi:hypothetical protein
VADGITAPSDLSSLKEPTPKERQVGNAPGLLVAEASEQLLADDPAKNNASTEDDGGLLVAVEQLTTAHDRYESERSDTTSSQNSAGDDGENRDLNLPKN